ncbi:hypothetical protein MHU86_16205 [Fragilaria crotonensis]|nr:hypothetical protein MHU86_16205 [Fragilaria crotonensis]
MCGFKILFLFTLLLASNAQNSTDTCTIESALLNKNSEISELTSAFQTEAVDSLKDYMKNCNLFQRRCAKDLSTLPSAVNLTDACVAEGGQIVYEDVRLKCEGSVQNVPIPGGFSVAADKFPACLGPSCDPNNLPTAVTEVFSVVTNTAKTEIEKALGDSITCQESAGLRIAISTVSLVLNTVFLSWLIS